MAKSISLGTMIRSLSEDQLKLFIEEVSTAIDAFIAMGSKKTMGDDPWVNFLIQSTSGRYGWSEIKVPASWYLKPALAKYIGTLKCTGTGSILRWVYQASCGQSSREVVSKSVIYFKECRAKHVVRDLSDIRD